jgi:hypothetical protein
MPTETTFLDEQGITVTNSRFVAGGRTFAMSGITSVHTTRTDPSRKGPIILIVLGLIFLAAYGIGLLGIIGGVLWWMSQKPEFSIVLSSASGQVQAYTSQDSDFISRIVGAVNEAIIARG